jgi:glycosyltransferase involved in cell wall biosynthesis
MKIVHINTFPRKATGQIMLNIHKKCLENGMDSYVVWGRGRAPENDREISMYDKLGIAWHGIYTRLTDKTGFASVRATKKLIKKLEEIKPDIVQLHNLHGYYINIEMLFNYFSAHKNIKIIWTLHDCWAFTGHCVYFDAVGCEKWKSQCEKCPQKKTYPSSLFLDNSSWNYKKKKELFNSVENMTLVTPSQWLADLVKQSFLSKYPVKVIHNGVDTSVFKPVDSDFRKNNNLENKVIILGVASEWTPRKGLDDFIKLAELLDDNYKIVLVGLNKKQLVQLPQNILGIERTESVGELVEIYSAADVFFNPTYEDNYPTTNLEAIACGTPVVTYNTGGSPECGAYVIESRNIDAFNALIKEKNITLENDTNKLELMTHEYLFVYS